MSSVDCQASKLRILGTIGKYIGGALHKDGVVVLAYGIRFRIYGSTKASKTEALDLFQRRQY